MRILYNSKDKNFKTPFGTLTEGQKCKISVHIPASCKTVLSELIFLRDGGEQCAAFTMKKSGEYGDYEIYSCNFALADAALYFYYFRITTENECFSLYREDYDMTNMEAGELWQLSVIPVDFKVPAEYAGAVMYQIFPDRFCRAGECDLAGKLEPFWFHERTDEIPNHKPNEKGEVENCDFFGGNLKGIASKLDYLVSLGVKVIYLNPIFKAWSNHRYDTADYMKIDEALGTEKDLSDLCHKAHDHGMKIILDGVFSHTGSNSVYFDRENIFGNGAYHNADSPYREWYDFKHYPDDYTSWWGIETLPCLMENTPSFRNFIIEAEDSVLAHWMRAGIDGFRLDVADELPDSFISAFRKRLKGLDPNALLLGEVWEDASNKISYGERRRYFTDGELDSVMNYPFRKGIIDYVTGADDGRAFSECVMTIAENYPTPVLHTLMNMLSTHDTPRILSLLSPERAPEKKDERATHKMSDEARKTAMKRFRAATFLQFVLPGMPCIFYGDELGTEGLEDPFCRSFFDWERVDGNELRDFFVSFSKIRRSEEALVRGDIELTCPASGVVKLVRHFDGDELISYVNMSKNDIFVDSDEIIFEFGAESCGNELKLSPYGFALIKNAK